MRRPTKLFLEIIDMPVSYQVKPMPRDEWRRRKERNESWAIAIAIFVFLGLFFLVARLAHAQSSTDTSTASTTSAWLNQLVSIIMLVVLSLVSTALGALAKKAHEWLATKVKNEKVRGVLDRLDDAAVKVVQAVEQSVVKSLDQTKSPGANAEAAKTAAMTSLKTQLGGDAGAEELRTVLGLNDAKAVEDMLSTAIESAVHELKAKKDAAKAA